MVVPEKSWALAKVMAEATCEFLASAAIASALYLAEDDSEAFVPHPNFPFSIPTT